MKAQRFIRRCVFGIVLALGGVANAASVTWVSSTNDRPWRSMPAPALAAAVDRPAVIRIDTGRTFQTIDGFGGCFNELGWIALNKLPADEKDRALSALFGDDGCAFNLARIPIGASDFAADGYSLAATPDDFDLKHFSIDRDRQHLLPFIKAAMTVRPTLRAWASPWSPPAWMKTNNSYAKGSLRWEPAILRTYANYFVRFIEAYRGEGVNLYAITPQNEPNISNVYPTCDWSGPQLREFIADYLGPTLRDRNTNIELWLGLNGDPPSHGDNANARLIPVLDDAKANAFLTGIGFQYDSRTQIGLAHRLYPDKKLMQSETECNGGGNSWADAQKLFQLMKRYFDNGANSYFAWNMVLDETGMSTWKWKQNALITADVTQQRLRLNGEYHVMRHFSRFIKPGAKRALTTGPWGDQIGFVNPDGSAVLVVGNSAKQPLPVDIAVARANGEKGVTVSLPAESVSTFVIAAE